MILYFSAMGNSQYVAQTIAEAAVDTLVSLREALADGRFDLEIADGEDFGLVVPDYFHGLPTIVIGYMEKVHIALKGTDHFCYLVATYGMDAGNIGSTTQEPLAGKGIELDATYMCARPSRCASR